MIYSKEFKELNEYRQNVSDSDLTSVCIVCYEDDINEALTSFKKQYNIEIEKILLPSADRTSSENSFEGISVENLEDNFDKDNLAVYVNINKNCTMNIVLTNKKEKFYFFTDEYYSSGCFYYRKPTPSLYLCHKSELKEAYNLFSSKKSKKVFLQRLKSIMTGRYGYLSYEEGFEYFPKDLMPSVKKGAVVVDAGIGSYLNEIKSYSKLVGNNGKVYAFEASLIEYQNLKQDAQKYSGFDNIELINLGLWNENTTMKMTVSQSASSVAFAQTGETIDCKLVTLDDFVKERGLEKVDYIKMDIEGAELHALKGAKDTIKKHKPDMAVCVYHFTSHLWELILYINSVYSGYDFYLYHHSPGCGETVLYAVKKSLKGKILNLFKQTFNFSKQISFFKNICKSFLSRSKRVLVYGAGIHFDELYSQGVFKDMNIIGVSDLKFEKEGLFKEYKAVPPSKIAEYAPEFIYIAMKDKPLAYDYLHGILKEKIDSIEIINL